jgi:hypothetical protein
MTRIWVGLEEILFFSKLGQLRQVNPNRITGLEPEPAVGSKRLPARASPGARG